MGWMKPTLGQTVYWPRAQGDLWKQVKLWKLRYVLQIEIKFDYSFWSLSLLKF